MKNKYGKNFFNVLVCLAVVLALTLGCKQIQDLAKRGQQSGSNSNSTTSTPKNGKTNGGGEADGGLSKKTNLYISECFNKYSNRVIDSYRRYQSWVKDMDNGPTGKESIVYGLYDLNGDGTDCADAVVKAKDMQPSLPEAEDAAEKFVTALKDAAGQIKAIYPYYNQDDYKDDKFQKGKDAHAGLVKSLKNFESVNKVFADQIDKLEDQVAQANLDRYKDNPDTKFEYLVTDSGVKAKKIVRIAQQTKFEDIKVEDLQPLIDDFDKANTDIKTAGSKNPIASMYFSASDDFLKAAKEMMRRIRDKKPFTDFERGQMGNFGWTVEGSPDKVIHAYNDLISRRSFMR